MLLIEIWVWCNSRNCEKNACRYPVYKAFSISFTATAWRISNETLIRPKFQWVTMTPTATAVKKEQYCEAALVDGPIHFYRAMLCIRGTSHGPVSVCVCLSQVGVLLKRLNVGSHKQHHTIAQGHPLRGRRMQVGWVKIGDFWLITGYISKTVQDRHILPIKVE